jgi:hypothetical protein
MQEADQGAAPNRSGHDLKAQLIPKAPSDVAAQHRKIANRKPVG